MLIKFNRFAIIPKHCDCCKRFIWLEVFRRSDVWHSMARMYWKENVCRKCIDKYLPYIKEFEIGESEDK